MSFMSELRQDVVFKICSYYNDSDWHCTEKEDDEAKDEQPKTYSRDSG